MGNDLKQKGMPLSWNEIRTCAHAFSKEWQEESAEDAEAKSFWDNFFNLLFWKGILIVEHKSRGKSLDKAYTQALDYFDGIRKRDLPKYVLISDFARFFQEPCRLSDVHMSGKLIGN